MKAASLMCSVCLVVVSLIAPPRSEAGELVAPVNGEVKWRMGAPIVTRCGDILVSRVGRTILHHLGLDLFVARSQQEYVDKACAFARQLDQLNAIRQSLRPLLLQSPLCDAQRLGRDMEEGFRTMWRTWVHEQEGRT